VRRVAVAIAIVWIVLRWILPTTWFVFDDAFFYFGIARNLAHGRGSTFDGLHPTNGYHPLWLAVCTLPHLLGFDDDVAVRIDVSIGILALLGAAISILKILERQEAGFAPKAVVLLALFSPFGITVFANGLESSASVLFLALLLERLDAHGKDLFAEPVRPRIEIALLACGAFLSRTDAVFLLPWLGGWMLVRSWNLRRAAQMLGPPIAVVAAYMAVNQLAFGAATQVSGDLKRVTPNGLAVVMTIALLAAPFLFARQTPSGWLQRTPAFVSRTFPMLGFVCSLLAYYQGFQRYQQLWYFVGPILFGVTLLAHLVMDADADGKKSTARTIVAIAALGVIANVVDVLRPGRYAMNAAQREAGVWVRDNVPNDAVLGSWDSGAIGYYSHRNVINLDGEANSVAYARALRAGKSAEWAKDERIDYVVNNHDASEGERGMQLLAASFLGDDRLRGSTLVRSWPFTYRGATNRHAGGTHEMAVMLLALDPTSNERARSGR
jgi:hypothetical protein